MMKKNFEYIEIEEGKSQYEEYDLTENKTVDAIYVRAKLEIDQGNKYIEALPFPRRHEDINREYKRILVGYKKDDVKKMTKFDKMMQISTLNELRMPLPFHRALEYDFYTVLCMSYRSRRVMYASNQELTYTVENEEKCINRILTGDPADATKAGLSMIGYSGAGKSSALSIWLSRYPQVIMHDDGNGGCYPQVVYLVVNCTANSNFTVLYEAIGAALDRALGNLLPVYATEMAKGKNLGKKAEKIKQYIEMFSIGCLIFDEIQLIDFEHTRENSFESLMLLANQTKVAMVIIGTEDARDKMFVHLRTARRIGQVIDVNRYCNNKEFFAFLVKQVFQYQWFDDTVPVTEDIIDALYDVTRGIVDQLINIYMCVNYDYLERKTKPEINGKYIRNIAKKYYPGIQDLLKMIRTPDQDKKYEEIKRNARDRIQELIDKESQDREMQLIQSDNSINEDDIQLSNVAANITAIYDEYSEIQIMNAYKQVKRNDAANGKSEKEITRMVIDRLQKKNNAKQKSKNKPIFTDRTQMENFLKLS